MIRALDVNHDWTFGQSQSNYLNENMEIKQNVECRIISFLGDCFFAVNDGIDWFNLLERNKLEELENAVQQDIIETDGVTAVNEIDVLLGSDRKLFLSYNIDTIYTNGVNSTMNLN